jgi:hypothetical protein
MVTEAEEIQAKEFLKRAEIRTMKKDLAALREVDALKERDKIVKIKTLEEQRAEQQAQLQAKEAMKAAAEKTDREEVLQKNAGQERMAEKDLKDYATEQERQQIFLLESQRLDFEKQIDAIDKVKDPALKLEKNKLLLLKREQQDKLNAILNQEKELEGEQKTITEKEQSTTILTQKKGLEQARWDMDKKIQDVEKKRWEAEKQVQDTDVKVSQTDKTSEQLVIEKNGLRDIVLGADKSLREIYSAVMAREEEKRRGQAQEQVAKKEAASETRAQENEKIQRQQWSPGAAKKDMGYMDKIPVDMRDKMEKSAQAEQEQRKKFIQNIEEKMTAPTPPAPKAQTTQAPPLPVPPAPRKKI